MKKVHILCFPLLLLAERCNQRSSKGHLAEEGHTLARICSQRSSKGHLAGKGHTYLHRTEPKDLLAKLPTHLQKEPRLIIGRTMPAYLRTPNDYEKVTIAGTTVFIPKSRGTCYVEGDGFTKEVSQRIAAYCQKKGITLRGTSCTYFESGQVALRTHDVTVDLEDGGDKSSDAPHVQKNAWDPATVQQIKKHGQKFGAIVFERVSTLPLYWDAYLQKLASHKDQHCYKFPDPSVKYGYPMGGNRDLLKAHYDQGYHFYVPMIKTTLPEAFPNASTAAPPTAYPDPTLVTTVLPSVPNPGKIPTTTNILKAYYDLLAPGGLFVFMSESSGVNRHGGCVFEYKGEHYSPFQDLDDPNMQAVYQSLLARAGFTEIKFKKDLYYTEDVLFIVAKKP